MDSEQLERPLNYLIPRFLTAFESPNDKIRYHAIHCVNQFIPSKPHALMVNLNAFIQVDCLLLFDFYFSFVPLFLFSS